MKTKRLLVLLLATFMLMFSLVGCSGNTIKEEGVKKEKVESMFVSVESTMAWRVVYHKDTKVMYAISDCSHNYGNFTLLVDADGKPMLWEGE